MWSFDAVDGTIRDESRNILATTPHSIAGDAGDVVNGKMMAASYSLALAVRELLLALTDHHTGKATTRAFAITYERDQNLIDETLAVLAGIFMA